MKAMKAIGKTFHRGTGYLSHYQVVTRMYRHALRTCLNWMDREDFYKQSDHIRAQFDANKHLDASSGEVARLVREGQEKLDYFDHPDPYVSAYMPGGTMFMRYSPPGPVASFPDGLPPEADVVPKTVDYVQVPKSGTPEGYDSVLVDFGKKGSD